MRGIGSQGTTPEVLLVRWLRKMGVSGWRQQARTLPGRPDLAFDAARLAVFLDGCFWHGCLACYRGPKSNRHYWRTKLRSNRARDIKANQALATLGWKVVRVWEHEVREHPADCVKLILRLAQAKRIPREPVHLVLAKKPHSISGSE